MQIIVLFKLNPMVESACLQPKPVRIDSLQKMAIIHHKNSRKRPIYHYFVLSISPHFLTRFFKIQFKTYTTLQPQTNGGIRVSVLKPIHKRQLAEDDHNSPWKLKKKANLSLFRIENISATSYLIFKIWYENYTTLQAQTNGGICMSVLKAV